MISRKDVQHVARLARLELTEAEEARFELELAAILDFVAKLNEADTAGVEPLTGGTELASVMREDSGVSELHHASPIELVEAAPKTREGWVEVKAVFERE